jgi:uncharacterized protein
MRPSEVLDRNRVMIRELAARHRMLNPRVFGSVARGDDRQGSDLDIMVDASPGADYLDLGGLQFDLQERLGLDVHLIFADGLKGAMRDRVLSDARPI